MKIAKRILAPAVAGLLILFFLWPYLHGTPNPVPANVKHQANFTILYPAGYRIDASSWEYASKEKVVSFTARQDGYSVIYTEQQTPLAYQDDQAAYERFIGGLRPSANFKSKLGSVALSTFVFSSDYQPSGTTGILNAKGTMLLAHPSQDLTSDQWHSVFNSLRAD